MPSPGLYLVNASGEAVPLETEAGDGDRELAGEVTSEYELLGGGRDG
jgi:hypothetical protein